MKEAQPTEGVRLVIWDLDETFWKGTLSEGGISFLPEHRDIVVELARRGIMSSICSKNDLDSVRSILEANGVWEYFIFPNINWEPKGSRIVSIIAAAQLRPETVIFIDDNQGNLNEARFYTPGLQVATEGFITEILDHPSFSGKNDRDLSRLSHYKVLERRKADEQASAGDNIAFLKSSGIRVEIQHDIEPSLDRAIELINRTNQLNFTKARLPEEINAARIKLRHLISRADINAGLVNVYDRYGHYGYCGFFAVQIFPGGSRQLLHFAFSCRILSMGVEHYVYNLLGRPSLSIIDDVLSDPRSALNVDWIDCGTNDLLSNSISNLGMPFFLRGGCDLAAIEHYARLISSEVIGEYNIVRNGISLRLDHSLVVRQSLNNAAKHLIPPAYKLGYLPEDFNSSLFSSPRRGCWVFSLIPDQWVSVYQHKTTGTLVPFFAEGRNGLLNLCSLSEEQRESFANNKSLLAAIDALGEEFTFVGRTPEKIFKESLTEIFKVIPEGSIVFILLNKEYYGNEDILPARAQAAIDINTWTQEVASQFPYVRVIKYADFLTDPSDVNSDGHFNRMVYYRIFEHIVKSIQPAEPNIRTVESSETVNANYRAGQR